MFSLCRLLSLHRWSAAWLIALALAVRLIVPAGFMPMAGQVGLQICAGQTADMPDAAAMQAMGTMDHAAHVAPEHGADHDTPMSGASEHDCGFGAAVGGAAALPALILPALLAPVALPAVFIRAFIVRPGLGLAAPPPPKTGPPITLR